MREVSETGDDSIYVSRGGGRGGGGNIDYQFKRSFLLLARPNRKYCHARKGLQLTVVANSSLCRIRLCGVQALIQFHAGLVVCPIVRTQKLKEK